MMGSLSWVDAVLLNSYTHSPDKRQDRTIKEAFLISAGWKKVVATVDE
jgi:hypothetical protein